MRSAGLDDHVRTYVPVNDKLDGGAVPLLRSRQSRAFATMRLNDPFVFLRWNVVVPDELRDALERLCGKVTRIGHSSSLVQMWIADAKPPGESVWRPVDKNGEWCMRITEKGTLAYLQRAFNAQAIEEYARLTDELETAKAKRKKELKELLAKYQKGGPAPVRPVLTCWQGYTKRSEQDANVPIEGPFDPHLIVFRCKPTLLVMGREQRSMGMEATLQLTSALRDAAMKAVCKNVPEWLSGHRPDGRPSPKLHAAFFPLPFVGGKYGDGHVMGLAMALPRTIDAEAEDSEESRRHIIGSLLFREDKERETIKLWRNKDGKAVWEWEIEREKSDSPQVTLRSATWTGPAMEWASVTPVVLHHYPKRKRLEDVARIVLEAFESAKLPRPIEVRVQPVSVFAGTLSAKSMPAYTEGGETMCRYQTHIVACFAAPVRGPLLVGRGRFRGYGLLRPTGVRHG